ncbi:hypothetical protein BH11BAC6_BH11BAC6_17240 [soil metagenome]
MDNNKSFTINVNGKKYIIEALETDKTRFKVSTDCDYLFTLTRNYNMGWQMESDVTALDDDIADNIGSAIENYLA